MCPLPSQQRASSGGAWPARSSEGLDSVAVSGDQLGDTRGGVLPFPVTLMSLLLPEDSTYTSVYQLRALRSLSQALLWGKQNLGNCHINR